MGDWRLGMGGGERNPLPHHSQGGYHYHGGRGWVMANVKEGREEEEIKRRRKSRLLPNGQVTRLEEARVRTSSLYFNYIL